MTSLNTTNTSVNSSSSNSTLEPEWDFMPVCSLITLIFGLIGNLLLLLLFLHRRILWTPFNVYLMSLLLGNLAVIIVQYPLDVIANLYSLNWWMGESACTFYLYSVFVLQGVTGNTHQLIAINRVWAVVHPVSYRNHHTFRVAVLLCLGVWIYSHVSNMPGWILDALYYRLPVATDGCNLNTKAQPIWIVFSQLIVYDMPVVTMLVALVVIWVAKRMRQRRKQKVNLVIPFPSSITKAHPVSSSDGHSAGMFTATRSSPLESGIKNPDRRRVRAPSRGTVVLVSLTVSFMITWVPINSYFTMLTFVDGEWPEFYQVATVLFSFQPVIDLILFTLSVGSIRNELKNILSGFL